jgi:hypothetical protein
MEKIMYTSTIYRIKDVKQSQRTLNSSFISIQSALVSDQLINISIISVVSIALPSSTKSKTWQSKQALSAVTFIRGCIEVMNSKVERGLAVYVLCLLLAILSFVQNMPENLKFVHLYILTLKLMRLRNTFC